MLIRCRYILAVMRRRPVSLLIAASLTTTVASITGTPIVLALLSWCLCGCVGLVIQPAVDRVVIGWARCRLPNRLEAERLTALTARDATAVLVCDAGDPWLVHLRGRVVISSALLDLLDDRAVLGLLVQATQPMFRAAQAAEPFVWSAVIPSLLCGWLLTRCVGALGKLLATLIGWALLGPMIVCPDGFVRWAGRVCSGLLWAIISLLLAEGGLIGLTVLLVLSSVTPPIIGWVMRWEWRMAETLADRATVHAGLGAQLMDALETLSWVQPCPPPRGVLGVLFRRGGPVANRAERIWRAVRDTR